MTNADPVTVHWIYWPSGVGLVLREERPPPPPPEFDGSRAYAWEHAEERWGRVVRRWNAKRVP